MKKIRPKRRESNTSCDIHYFDKWGSNMAYILGFLFADGSISSNCGTVGVDVTESDRPVLEFMKLEMKATREIKRYAYETGSTRPFCRFAVSSVLLVDRLQSLGMYPRKTFRNDPFPPVPDAFVGDFIRGFFDGDGSVTLNPDAHCRIKLIGTPDFIQGLQERLNRLANLPVKSLRLEKGKQATWTTVAWSKPKELRAFADLVYPTGFGFCLERKRRPLIAWLNKPRVEMKVWTDQTEEVVKRFYRDLGPYRVGKMIDRSSSSVRIKAQRLGLTYTPSFKRSK